MPEMRIGAPEREKALALLRDHFADGYLDETEIDERFGRVMRAKTVRELAAVTSDLPTAESRHPLRAASGFWATWALVLGLGIVGIFCGIADWAWIVERHQPASLLALLLIPVLLGGGIATGIGGIAGWIRLADKEVAELSRLRKEEQKRRELR